MKFFLRPFLLVEEQNFSLIRDFYLLGPIFSQQYTEMTINKIFAIVHFCSSFSGNSMEADYEELLKVCVSRSRNKELKDRAIARRNRLFKADFKQNEFIQFF